MSVLISGSLPSLFQCVVSVTVLVLGSVGPGRHLSSPGEGRVWVGTGRKYEKKEVEWEGSPPEDPE